MVSRLKGELEQTAHGKDLAEEARTQLMVENEGFGRDFEMARAKIDELLTEESRM